jgi:hypothetical protein
MCLRVRAPLPGDLEIGRRHKALLIGVAKGYRRCRENFDAIPACTARTERGAPAGPAMGRPAAPPALSGMAVVDDALVSVARRRSVVEGED